MSNPDIAYKKMGLVGMLKMVAFLGEANSSSSSSASLVIFVSELLMLNRSSRKFNCLITQTI